MRSLAVFLCSCLAAMSAVPVSAQSVADSAAIRNTALDYIDGWYAADASRMAHALHPELVKRIVHSGPGQDSRLSSMTAAELIEATGGRRPAAERRSDVRILDIFGDAASVRVDAVQWVDYLHLARWNGEWRIINVLWELRRP